jgi:hypothetical protein
MSFLPLCKPRCRFGAAWNCSHSSSITIPAACGNARRRHIKTGTCNLFSFSCLPIHVREHHRPQRAHQCSAAPAFAANLSFPLLSLTSQATFKLGLICSIMVYVVRQGRLPPETPSVLSKLAFNVTIPCMLVTKTAETLARTQGDWKYLMIPVAICVQVPPSRCIVCHPSAIPLVRS